MHSTAPDNEPAPPHPSLVLAPFAERFFDGRRVAILGDSTSGLAQAVASRGARHVHVYDPDAARASRAQITHASRGVAYAPLSEGEPGIRDGAYDVTLIPDLTAFSQVRTVLARARQVTSGSGVVVVATPYVEGKRGESAKGAGPLNYYDLYDALSRHFPSVKMAGQVPFQGYALVDFGAQGELEVSVDTSLAEEASREPEFFLAVASERRVAIDPYSIVQLPTHEAPAAGDRGASEADRLALVETRTRLEALKAELEVAREGRRAADAKLHEEQRRSAELSRALTEAESLPRQLERRLTEEARRAELLSVQANKAQEQLDRLNKELRAQADRATQLQRSLAASEAREGALTARLRELEATPRGVDSAEHQALLGQLQSLAIEHERLEREVESLGSRAERAEAEAAVLQEAHAADVVAAETQLRERAREIALLRLEIDRRGAMVRELLETLESREAPSLGPSVVLDRERLAHLEQELVAARGRVEGLTSQLGRREAEVRAAAARVAELEKKLESSTTPASTQAPPAAAAAGETPAAEPAAQPATPSDLTAQLEAAQAEIEALRRALLQERQARLTAETPSADEGAGFASTLLEQLDAERG